MKTRIQHVIINTDYDRKTGDSVGPIYNGYNSAVSERVTATGRPYRIVTMYPECRYRVEIELAGVQWILYPSGWEGTRIATGEHVSPVEVRGIKAAVGDVRRETMDRWFVALDTSDWTVREFGAWTSDEITTRDIILASGYASGNWRSDITMWQLHNILAGVLTRREHARAEYKSGMRHGGWPDESLSEYVRTEMTEAASALWDNERER